jgi:hypothetical protein
MSSLAAFRSDGNDVDEVLDAAEVVGVARIRGKVGRERSGGDRLMAPRAWLPGRRS